MIDTADISRLTTELSGNSTLTNGAAWLDEIGMTVDAMREIVVSACRAYRRLAGAPIPDPEALIDIVGQVFRLGWETHAQYGGRS